MVEATRRARPAKLLFVVSEDWYFHSHRLPLAVAALARGFDVAVATRVTAHGDAIRAAGIRLVPISMRRRSMNLLDELRSVSELRRILAAEQPDIVHNVAIKPVLHGSIAARLAGCRSVVNAIAGMGFVFSSQSMRARVAKPLVSIALGVLLRGKSSRVIVQNPEDQAFLVERGLARSDRITLIRGSGVDTERFGATPEPDGVPVVMLASRMLRDKGIPCLVAAARLLNARDVRARFVLVGGPDPGNPASLTEQELLEMAKAPGVEWWGARSDMPEVLAQANVVCLPTTYGEGIPKVLIEAASCARAIVATDVQGCREVVQPGVTGLLVPPSDPEALAAAVQTLICDGALRSRMGQAGRALVQREFSIERVVADTLALYDRILSEVGP